MESLSAHYVYSNGKGDVVRDSMVTGLSVTISMRTELIQLGISFSSAGQLLLKAFVCIYLTCDEGSAVRSC